jgi:FdhD protein
MTTGAVSAKWLEYRQGWEPAQAEVIEEAGVSIYVNGLELATILCTPCEQELLALGFLRNEGLIEGMDELDHVRISPPGCCVDVWLTHSFAMPERRIITSGCGAGVTFRDPSLGVQPIEDDLHLDPESLFILFGQLNAPGSLYARARGVHTAALSDGERILALAEDVGRHNAVDRLQGACMLHGIETRGRILLSTGRMSSEMLYKSARMGCPIVASRNSPTSMSVAMAEAWRITLIGYVRRHTLRVYTHPERLTPGESAAIAAAP